MASESDLYSHELYGARYLQSLEAYSFNALLPGWRERPAVRSWTPEAYFERVIKIHALFGGRITITSITPIGSTVLLSLFAKPDFQAFLRRHPSFLDFCSNFGGDTRIERVLSGLNRTKDSKWVSSLFAESDELSRNLGTELVRTTAQTILGTVGSHTSIDLGLAEERLDQILSRFRDDKRVRPRQMEILKAVPKLLDHFINNGKTHVYRSSESYVHQAVQKVIGESLNQSNQSGLQEQDYKTLKSVAETLATRCDLDATFSQIITAIDGAAELSEDHKKTVLQTACYAYNHNLENAIAVQFRSQIKLPAGVPVGKRSAGVHSVVVTSTDKEQIKALGQYVSDVTDFNCDLDHIGWGDIRKAMDVSHIARSAVYFQNHLIDRRPDFEAARYNLKEHANNLSAFFIKEGVFQPPSSTWLVVFGGMLGFGLGLGLGLVIGPSFPDIISKAPVVGGQAGILTARYAIHRHQEYAACEMLREAGEEEFIGHR